MPILIVIILYAVRLEFILPINSIVICNECHTFAINSPYEIIDSEQQRLVFVIYITLGFSHLNDNSV